LPTLQFNIVINYRSLELNFSQFSPTVITITVLLCFIRCIISSSFRFYRYVRPDKNKNNHFMRAFYYLFYVFE